MLRGAIIISQSLSRHSGKSNFTSLVTKRNGATAVAAQSIHDEWESAKPFAEMPGPKPLPLIGNIWRFLPYVGNLSSDIFKEFHQLSNVYGEVFKLTNLPGLRTMVFISDPNEIEKVFRNEGPWPNRPALESLKYYRYVTRKDVYEGIGGTVASQNEEWQTFRSKVNPILMQPRSSKMYVSPMDAVANDFIDRMRFIRDEKQEMPTNFVVELHKWAMESIIYIGLDTRLGCLRNDLKEDSEPTVMLKALEDIFHAAFSMQIFPAWKYFSTPTWKTFVKAMDTYNALSLKYINEATERLKNLPAEGRELTVLEKLLTRDSNPKTAMVMVLDMFSAGVETTSYSTVIALYMLAKNPEKQEELFKELRQYLPEKNTPITLEILNELKYVKACIKETMRLSSVVPGNVRTLTKDMAIAGYRVPKNTDVVFMNAYVCKSEKHFRDPLKFIPERWIRPDENTRPEAKSAHPFVFMPFGFGPRMCLGRRFAELEIEIALAKIIRNFRVEFNYEDPIFKSKLLYIPITPMKFTVLDRE